MRLTKFSQPHRPAKFRNSIGLTCEVYKSWSEGKLRKFQQKLFQTDEILQPLRPAKFRKSIGLTCKFIGLSEGKLRQFK